MGFTTSIRHSLDANLVKKVILVLPALNATKCI